MSRVGLLRPRTTATRLSVDLSGAWRFAFEAAGDAPSRFLQGLSDDRLAAVPGAWNEQLTGGLDQVHAGWYERAIEVPAAGPDRRWVLRFDAAALVATVWLDGEIVGEHQGGFLPFAFDVTDRLTPGREHRLTVRVEHGLSVERTPVGTRPGGGAMGGYPSTSYDFFPMGGLIRPVRLLSVPQVAIEGLRIETPVSNGRAAVELEVDVAPGAGGVLQATLGDQPAVSAPIADGKAVLRIDVADARLWSPADPHLQTLRLELKDGERLLDTYVQPVGLRSVAVEGERLLLNGEPVFLKGFGKHEDFPVYGRGLAEPVVVRDAELMRWVGANSYRTSHYPYAEEALEVADRRGLLVISETSAVGLNFYDRPENDAPRLAWVRAELEALIARDRNHPSVIAWSVANEPFAKPLFQGAAAAEDSVGRGVRFLSQLVEDVRRLDPQRPVMVVGAQGHSDEFLALGDIVAINRYYGWYSEAGRPEDGVKVLERELDALQAKFGRPILVSEFGTDTLPGFHSAEAEMWTEEYQVRFLELYLQAIAARPNVIGAHVWNFADFKTGQGLLRAGGLNHKGVFTRDRRPKMAAHLLRRWWGAGG